MLRTVAIVGITFLCCASLALGEESVLGEYTARLQLADGTHEGTARVEWHDRSFELTLDLEARERQVLPGRKLADGTLVFEIAGDGPPTVGLVGRIAGPPAAGYGTAQVVRVERLPLRSEPKEDAPVVAHARSGQSLEVVDEHWTRHELEAYNRVWETKDWVEVRLPNGRSGWAPTPFVLVTRPHVEADTVAEHSIHLRRAEGRLEGPARQLGDVVGQLQLKKVRRQRRALISYGARFSEGFGTSKDRGEERAFRGYGQAVARWYRANKGFQTEVFRSLNATHYAERLEQAAAAGIRYDLLVIIGHGGWDGPTIGKAGDGPMQVSGRDHDSTGWDRFVAAIRAGTHPSARIFASSCHAGGSDWVERSKENWTEYNWVEDVALRTGRVVAGPAGLTSTEWTERHVLASFEGVGTVRQEMHVAGPDGLRIVRPGRAVRSAPVRVLPHTANTLDPSSYRVISAGDLVGNPG